MPFKTTSEESRDLSPSHSSHPSHSSQMLPAPTENPANDQYVNARSLLGRAVFVKGSITAKETMHINGRVEGSIALEEHKLEIGEEGRIQANIIAEDIVISGEVIGDVYGKQVTITKTGRITGNIYTPNFSIEDGGLIQGNIDMQKQDHLKQATSDMQDENQGKNSGFGFLFNKKDRDVSSTDIAVVRELQENINISDELIPLAVDSNIAAECPYSERSVIGESVIIHGELIAEEDIVIYGHVLNGIIYSKKNSVGIGPNAQIKTNILAKSLLAHGEIRCEHIYASDRVIIKKPAHVYAKIHAPRVSSEVGAEVNGGIDMAPQNIEEIFANMGGSVTVLEHPHEDEENNNDNKAHKAKTKHNTHERESNQNANSRKDSAWPIFYPRS